MDSPKSDHHRFVSLSTSTTPEHLQDSPFFSYLHNLSPIMPGRAVSATQGLSEITFPHPLPMFPMPHVNHQQEASFVKRSKFSCISNSEFSLAHNNRDTSFAGPSNFAGQSSTQSMAGSVPQIQMKNDSYKSVQVQPCSFLYPADQFLDNDLSLEACSELCSREALVPQALQSDGINSKGLANTGRKEDLCPKLAAQVGSGQETEVGALRNPTWFLNSVENEGVKDGQWPSNDGLGGSSQKIIDIFQSDMPPKPFSDVLHSQNSASQIIADSLYIMSHKEHRDFDFSNYQSACSRTLYRRGSEDDKSAGDTHQHGLHLYTQVLPKPLPFIGREKHDESCGSVSEKYVRNKRPYAFEDVNHNQGSISRRCLRFETAEVCHAAGGTIFNSSPPNPTGIKTFASPYLKPLAAPCNSERANFSQPTTYTLPPFPINRPEIHVDMVSISIRDGGKSPMEARIPSGIGFHLDGDASVSGMGCTAAESLQMEMNWSSEVKEYPCTFKPRLPASTTVSGRFPTNITDVQQDNQTIVMETVTSQPTESTKHLDDSLQPNLIGNHLSTGDKSMPSLKVGSFDKLSEGPKRKRMKRSRNDLGCKNCNCKKSKCLKLYCECFSAGLYCADSCTCHECYNKVEYDDTVLETRKQIESRNPLAFAPKVVRRVMESPSDIMESINQVTPSSVWHKKGCNCKKSQCQKKYCECYQAAVGCSMGCRCQGCKNVFGVKEEYTEAVETIYTSSSSERWKDPSDDKDGIMDNRSDVLRNLPPPTLSFQSSNCLPSESSSSAKSRNSREVPQSQTLYKRPDPEGGMLVMLEDDLREPSIKSIKEISPYKKRVSSPRFYLGEHSENSRRLVMQQSNLGHFSDT